MAMQRRGHVGPFRSEFDDILSEMESRFNALLEGFETTPLLPGPGMRGRFAAVMRGEFKVDVREKDDEIIVEADLPGVEKEDVTIRLCNPRTLEISSERKGEKEEKREGFYMRERAYGMLRRIVGLPADATEDGATASFKNGVLEVHLKKAEGERSKRIPID
jgi:HSP20 family protein